MWWQFVMAGINMAEGYNKAKIAQTMEDAQYKLRVARRDNKELLRKESNKLATATANLKRVEQSLYNQRLGRDYERSKEQSDKQYAQVVDGLTSDRFTSRLQSSQALGALAAQAAYNGVGGGSVAQLEQVESLRQARVESAINKSEENAHYAKAITDVGLLDNYVSQVSTSSIFADIDYTAPDLVFNNSWQHKWTIGKAAMDGMNGFMYNMNNLNMDLSQYRDQFESGGSENKGIGGAGKSQKSESKGGGFSFTDMFSSFGGSSSSSSSSAGSSGGSGSSSGWRLW
ncbi:putative structural protein [Vibrio phage vB_VpaP_G1]|uniref:Structural protein n=1 Tax=Vibrio phage vB_VpaP_G1 TaxID=2862773 RepID=A0AAE7WU63_9CAUD|nr:internal virion protein [Vibrio phage vB_VpaP_G1]QYW05825.1 putative structural protein [Vibrio phage vB_VpaP_G1]